MYFSVAAKANLRIQNVNDDEDDASKRTWFRDQCILNRRRRVRNGFWCKSIGAVVMKM